MHPAGRSPARTIHAIHARKGSDKASVHSVQGFAHLIRCQARAKELPGNSRRCPVRAQEQPIGASICRASLLGSPLAILMRSGSRRRHAWGQRKARPLSSSTASCQRGSSHCIGSVCQANRRLVALAIHIFEYMPYCGAIWHCSLRFEMLLSVPEYADFLELNVGKPR